MLTALSSYDYIKFGNVSKWCRFIATLAIILVHNIIKTLVTLSVGSCFDFVSFFGRCFSILTPYSQLVLKSPLTLHL